MKGKGVGADMTLRTYLRACIHFWPLFAALVGASILFHYWTANNPALASTTPLYSASSTLLTLGDPTTVELIYLPLATLQPVLDDATARLELDRGALNSVIRAELLQGSYLTITATTQHGETSARSANAVADSLVAYSHRIRGSELASIQAERERWPLAPDSSFGAVVSRQVAVVERARVPANPDPIPAGSPWWVGFLVWGAIGLGTAGAIVGGVLWWREEESVRQRL